MTAITLVSIATVLSVVLVPAVAEVARIHAERTNPIRQLRIPTRRHQTLASASGRFGR